MAMFTICTARTDIEPTAFQVTASYRLSAVKIEERPACCFGQILSSQITRFGDSLGWPRTSQFEPTDKKPRSSKPLILPAKTWSSCDTLAKMSAVEQDPRIEEEPNEERKKVWLK